MDTVAVSAKNPVSPQNRKLASQAVVKPHAALREFASHPEAIIAQPRGMAIIDKIDECIAAANLTEAISLLSETNNSDAKEKVTQAQLEVALAQERINERITAIPTYEQFIHETNRLTSQMKLAVEKYGVSDKENVPFYRVLKEQIIQKST